MGEHEKRERNEAWLKWENAYDARFPKVHDIEVKAKGKDARWESVKAILTPHRDEPHCLRRVWIRFCGSKPTMEELALKWPEDKEAVTQ